MQGSRQFAFAAAVAIVLVVAAPGPTPALASAHRQVASTPVVATAGHLQREIFGFALASSLGDPSIGYQSWNFDLLSTVAFFGVHVTGSSGQFAGDSGWSVWNSFTLTSMVSTAHQHGAKVVLTVILQDFSPNTPNMCAGLQHADATVAQTVSEVKAKAVDGVNIDYEGLDGSCGTNDPYWAQHAMTTFAQKMRSGLGSSYYLSVDTYASSAIDGYGFFDVAGMAPYVDSFFVMAYDLEYSNYLRSPVSCPSFCLGPTAPLTGYYYNDTAVTSQYVAAVGASKVILGVPYYGRKSCVGGVVPNALPTSSVVADSYVDASTESSDPAVQVGSFATHRDANSSGMERWDTWYNTTLGCTRELYWDDATSLGKKYDLVNANQLRGVGIWNLNYGGGAPELWAALQNRFAGCAVGAITASPASPQQAGTRITFTASSSICANPRYEFFMRVPSQATWQLVQGYSAGATYTWNSTGALAGAVYLGVWVRDAGSTAAYDSYTSTAYVVSPSCTSVSASAVPTSVAFGSGTHVKVTAAASGCTTSPRYEFWIRAASQSAWQLVQAYSGSATYEWNSAGALPGTEYLGVWVRDTTSSAGYDAFTSIPYTVSPACTSLTLSAAPASVPYGSGAHVTFAAAAAGCTNSPRYEFWMRPAGSNAWQLVQGYGTSATYDWNSAGALVGTVYFSAWTRDASSTADYDTTTSIPYTVSPSCTSVTTSAAPTSVARGSGTHVTITAAAAGCSTSPRYEFWMRPASSSTWQLVQSYGTSPTYDWNSAGALAGTVYFSAWVRDASSTAGYDAFTSTPVTVS